MKMDDDRKEQLKTMLDAIIGDKSEEAEIAFHGYLTGKMQDAINPVADEDLDIDEE